MLLSYYTIAVAIATTAFRFFSPVMLTGKSITSSTASQVYFPESPGAGERRVRCRISPSSVMVTLALSWISSPSSSQRTTAPGRDTWTSRISGSPDTPSRRSPEPPLGEASFTGGSEEARRQRLPQHRWSKCLWTVCGWRLVEAASSGLKQTDCLWGWSLEQLMRNILNCPSPHTLRRALTWKQATPALCFVVLQNSAINCFKHGSPVSWSSEEPSKA